MANRVNHHHEAEDDVEIVDLAILFSDIVSSTPTIERLGNEAWSDVIRHHWRCIEMIVEQYGGEMVGFTGDGFMVVFEDEGEGVDCALRLQEALLIQANVSVRLGVASGEVVKFATDFVGLAVNVAARLCEMTHPGEVTIENDCYRRAARSKPLPLLEQRRVSVRGVSKPLTVRVSAAPRVPWLP